MRQKLDSYITKLLDIFKSRQHRSKTFLSLILIILIILILPALIFERSLKSSLHLNTEKYKDLIVLSSDYIQIKNKIDAVEKKRSFTPKTGITNVVNDIFGSLGVKDKVKSIKGISNRQLSGNITEESSEIYIEKLTMNEMVNLFHRIETSPMILSVKKATIKKSFEKPELLNVTITLALFNIPQEVQQ